MAEGLQAGRATVIVPYTGTQSFWGDVIHSKGVGPKPIPLRNLTPKALSSAIGCAIKPSTRSRAATIGKYIRNEAGANSAVRHFEGQLDVSGMRCSIFPCQPATWRFRKTDINLCDFAAAVLIYAGLVKPQDILQYHSKQYLVKASKVYKGEALINEESLTSGKYCFASPAGRFRRSNQRRWYFHSPRLTRIGSKHGFRSQRLTRSHFSVKGVFRPILELAPSTDSRARELTFQDAISRHFSNVKRAKAKTAFSTHLHRSKRLARKSLRWIVGLSTKTPARKLRSFHVTVNRSWNNGDEDTQRLHNSHSRVGHKKNQKVGIPISEFLP